MPENISMEFEKSTRRQHHKVCHIKKWAFLIFLLATTISLFVPLLPTMPAEGIDQSWVFGMNQAISQGLKIGRDIVYTFGPYASIYTRSYHPATDNLMIWGSIYFSLSFCFIAFLNFKNSNWCLWAILLVVLAGLTNSMDALTYYYPLLVGVYVFKSSAPQSEGIFRTAKWHMLLILATFPFGLLPLIKGSFLVICAAIVVLSLILVGIKHDWKGVAIISLAPITGLIFFWSASGQILSLLPSYLTSMLPIISGYTEAMAISGDIWEIIFFIIGAAIVLGTITLKIKANNADKALILLIFGVVLFVGFKGGFVRHDAHAITASSLLLLSALLVNSLNGAHKAYLTIFTAAFVWVYIDSNHANTNTAQFLTRIEATYINAYKGLDSRIFHREDLIQNFNRQVAILRAKSEFPTLDGTTDIYSYDQSYLIASGNKWNPRPIFQSYAAYTPQLASENRAHLLSSTRPDNLIFKIQPIDDRAPPMEDGASWPAIFTNYVPHALINGFLFLRKRTSPVASHVSILPKESHEFGETIKVPKTHGQLYVKINIEPSIRGKIISTLFKPSELVITVKMLNGITHNYRIISAIAKSGFLLSPFIESTNEFGLLYANEGYLGQKMVQSISVAPKGGESLWNPRFSLEFTKYELPPDSDVLNLYQFVRPQLQHAQSEYTTANKCEGNIDVINGISPAPANLDVKSLLTINGWLANINRPKLTPKTSLFGVVRKKRRYLFYQH